MNSPLSVDGIAPPAQVPHGPAPQPAGMSRAVRTVLMALFIPYALYLGWALFLMSVLPDASGTFDPLIPLGVLSAVLGGGTLLLLGGLVIAHSIQAKNATPRGRRTAMLRTTLFMAPGIILSAVMPFVIRAEPALPLDIVSPTRTEDLVAPVAVTFSLERAVEILQRRGLRPVAYAWDFDGDGRQNEESAFPTVTAVYQRMGGFNVAARITLADRSVRRVSRRLVIPSAVFSMDPLEPTVETPITFSVAHLVDNPANIQEVRWDFDADGVPEDVTTAPSITHAFVRLGTHTVRAVVLLKNQAQFSYERTFQVREPEPLPFPVRIVSEPKMLISPPPFGTIFRVETEEPIREVEWDFGDQSPKVKTTEEHKVGHTYERQGAYRLTAEVRAVSGETARLALTVNVVDTLRISDLTFDGSPPVTGNRIVAEVPVTLDLTPRTSLPLIEFFWEVPDATIVGSTDYRLQAVYRRPGTYIVTLLAKDPDGRAMRLPITVEAKPPASVIDFTMNPQSGVAPVTIRFDASAVVIPDQTISGFEWIFGDERLPGAVRRQGIAIEEFTFNQPGNIPVKLVVYTTSGKTYEATKTVSVRPPRLSACFQPTRIRLSLSRTNRAVGFDRTCTTGMVKSVRWDFGDGSESDDTLPTVVHYYDRVGTFTVTLTVEDASGAQSSDSVQITVDP